MEENMKKKENEKGENTRKNNRKWRRRRKKCTALSGRIPKHGARAPIKGRLGKNTTPTSISPTKLNQNLQVDP